jgi:hypothetical protein
MTDDWYTKPGKVEKGPEFPVLDQAKMYTLRLIDIPFQPNVTRVFKGDQRTADEITTIWEVEGTTAKVWQRFTYSWNVKANMVIFINRMGHYLPEGQTGTLAAYFTMEPPARVRCRLIPREKDGVPTGYYSIDMNPVQGAEQPVAAPPGPAPAPVPAQAPAQANPEVDRIFDFLKEGRFAKKDEAQSIAMKFLGLTDGTVFAAAWAKYQKQAPLIVGS